LLLLRMCASGRRPRRCRVRMQSGAQAICDLRALSHAHTCAHDLPKSTARARMQRRDWRAEACRTAPPSSDRPCWRDSPRGWRLSGWLQCTMERAARGVAAAHCKGDGSGNEAGWLRRLAKSVWPSQRTYCRRATLMMGLHSLGGRLCRIKGLPRMGAGDVVLMFKWATLTCAEPACGQEGGCAPSQSAAGVPAHGKSHPTCVLCQLSAALAPSKSPW
jgi:hypothetical protein